MKLNERLAKEKYIRAHYDLNKLKKPKPPIDTSALESILFPLQKEVLDAPSKRKCLFWGRRTGKTFLLAVALLREILVGPPRSEAYYFSRSRVDAKGIIWDQLLELVKRFNLPVKCNSHELTIRADRGILYLCGLDNRPDFDKPRGHRVSIVAIDEADYQRDHLNYFISSVLGPTMLDFNGTVYLSSTPNISCNGFFHDVTVGKIKEWKTWTATLYDNPAFPRWVGKADWKKEVPKVLAEERKKNGWTETTPEYRREYLCEWVRSKEVCVVPFNDDINIYTEAQTTKYIMGLDFGEVDQNAICVIGYNMYDDHIYVVDGSHFPSEGFEATCKTIMEFYNKYRPHTIVGDPNSGKVFMNDLARKYNIPIQSAYKRDKAQSIGLLGTDFLSGRIKFNPELKTEISQIKSLLWKDKEKGEMSKPRDFFDAFRYAYVETLGYKKKIKIKDVDPHLNPELWQNLHLEARQKKIREENRLN